MLGELAWIIELEIAINFVGRNVMQALVVLAHCLENVVRAKDVCLKERQRAAQRIIHV